MTRGLTLEQLIYNLRTEIGQSTNPAVSRSTRSRFIALLNRVQRRLYYDFDWPFREIHRDVLVAAGQRYYDFPTEIDMDRAIAFEVNDAGYWKKVGFRIGKNHLNNYNSDLDVRSDPVWRWDYYLDGDDPQPQWEAWPVPNTDADADTLDRAVRIHGTRKLVDMVNDADTCILDGDLLTLYSAAEVLSKLRSPDAPAKLENANSLYLRLKGRATPAESFTVGGDTFNDDCPRRGSWNERELWGGIYTIPGGG